ncbi:hypothetical protein [Streptomyces sp. W1SF4]|uniref:hypothetical protein n=1 Tax=Streptomyces sp. W1SF4 TaxID=2305220 RepID=UPI000F6BB8B1|nr:hypothetical protein [Streptomyces sp. W1SF4]AZM91445.1 hypothetical protein D1J60_25660 [Streptomyces sp. W1SF4]
MTIGLSAAGFALCVFVAYLNLRTWWNGSRDPKLLLHFGQGSLMGALASLCTGGLLGMLAGCTRQGVSAASDKAVTGLTGVGAGEPLAARSLAGQLTPMGALVVAVTAGITFAAYKAASKDDKRRLLGGLVFGLCMTITAGVAGALDGLPGLVNDIGAAGKRVAEGGSL